MKSLLCLFLLASAVAPAAETPPAIQTTTVNVLVTDRHGKPLPSARVVVNGSEHTGVSNNAGRVVFTNMKAGSYTLRVERDTFITFEKDFDVRDEKGPYLVVAAISPLASLAARPAVTSTKPRRYAGAQPAPTR
jgi:hypothetical protein